MGYRTMMSIVSRRGNEIINTPLVNFTMRVKFLSLFFFLDFFSILFYFFWGGGGGGIGRLIEDGS